MSDADTMTRAFEAGMLDPRGFSHADHVRVAWILLGEGDFLDAAVRYCRGLRSLAARAGVPEKFNLTITLVYLALIAQHRDEAAGRNVEDFLARHPELLDRTLLQRWYDRETLAGDAAQQRLVMPLPAL